MSFPWRREVGSAIEEWVGLWVLQASASVWAGVASRHLGGRTG